MESKFKSTNFGFRPNKNCFDAVKNFKIHSRTCNYIIEGHLSSAFKSIDHNTLLNILNIRIKDKKFLELIKQALSSGIMEENEYVHSLSGISQGGILSPLLFNIYMFEFDKFMYKVVQKYTLLSKPQQSEKHKFIQYEIKKLLTKKMHGYKNQLRQLVKQKLNTPFYNLQTISKNPIFVRYADKWLFGMNAEKNVVRKVKELIRRFLQTYLRIKLELKKTVILNYQKEGVNFLGYELKMWSTKQLVVYKRLIKTSKGQVRIKEKAISRKVIIRPSKIGILKNLFHKGICNKTGFPIGVKGWTKMEEFRIVERYRFIMLGIINYYINCDNLYALNQISHILQYSCAKTLATRKRMTMSQIFHKYGSNLKINMHVQRNDKSKIRSVEFLTFSKLKLAGVIERKRHKESTQKSNYSRRFSYYHEEKL